METKGKFNRGDIVRLNQTWLRAQPPRWREHYKRQRFFVVWSDNDLTSCRRFSKRGNPVGSIYANEFLTLVNPYRPCDLCGLEPRWTQEEQRFLVSEFEKEAAPPPEVK